MMWLAVLSAGVGSYLLRVAPLLLGDRVRLSARTDEVLRNASVGAMTALIVLAVQEIGAGAATPSVAVAALVAVLASGAVALSGRSLPFALLLGGVVYVAVAVGVPMLLS